MDIMELVDDESVQGPAHDGVNQPAENQVILSCDLAWCRTSRSNHVVHIFKTDQKKGQLSEPLNMIQASQLFAACSFKIITTQIEEGNTHNTHQVKLPGGAALSIQHAMIKVHT
jgi:hypothetical protein